MANASAQLVIPCCAKPGRCLPCCNGVTGIIMDLTGIAPAVGTYDHPDGGEVQIYGVEFIPAGIDHLRFGPALYAAGANREAMGPVNACCQYVIGRVDMQRRDSGGAPLGARSWVCFYAGISASGHAIYIGTSADPGTAAFLWFYRSLGSFSTAPGTTRYPVPEYICSQPIDWWELSNDTANALDSGIALKLKGTRIDDTGLSVVGPTTCGNQCDAFFDITITIGGFSGQTLGAYTFTDDEAVFTMSGKFSCGTLTVDTWSEVATLAMSHATDPDPCFKLTLAYEYDSATDVIRFSAEPADGAFGLIYTDCEDDGSFLEDVYSILSFDAGEYSCGDMTWTDTTTLLDETPDIPLSVTITEN